MGRTISVLKLFAVAYGVAGMIDLFQNYKGF